MSPDLKLARWALLAMALSAGTAACSGEPGDADGGGGEDGTGGGSEDGTGGTSEDGTGGTSEDGSGGTSEDGTGGLGGNSSGGQGGEATGGLGGDGSGGEGTGGSGPNFVQEKAFLLDNAINPYGTLITADGKIYISGTTDIGPIALGDTQQAANLRLAVWRLNADGSLDGDWGTGGKLTSAIANPGTSYDIVQLADGSFVVHFSGGPAGVSLVHLSAAGVFGTPTTITFGWTADDRTEVNDLCASAADAETAIVEATDGGVCDEEEVTYDAEACEDLQDAGEATSLACVTVWPAATAPEFAQRPTALSAENSWGIALDQSGAEEKIVVAASSSAAKVETGEQRVDTDRYITRVLASDFSVDPTFNGGSVFTVDVSNLGLNDNTRRVIVEADGSIVCAGYTNIADAFVGQDVGNHIALVRLLPNGTADPNFGFSNVDGADFNPGQTLYLPFTGTGAMAEAYAVARTSTGAYVTTGYGTSNFAEPSIAVDLVTTKYNPVVDQDGLDPTFGGNASGVVGGFAVQSEGDPNAGVSGTNPFMDRGRSIILLPDDRAVHGGVYDDLAALFVITPDGELDETVGNGTGRIQYAFPFGFFGLARSSDGLRIVGSSQSKARVNASTSGTTGATVPGSYAKSLVAIVDIE